MREAIRQRSNATGVGVLPPNVSSAAIEQHRASVGRDVRHPAEDPVTHRGATVAAHRGTKWAKSKRAAKIAWLAVALVLPLANLWFIEYWKASVAIRQVKLQEAAARTHLQSYENRVFDGLWPLISRASGLNRLELLDLLAKLAPSTFDRVAALEIAKSVSKSQGLHIERLQRESHNRMAELDFDLALATARQYAVYPIAGQEARAFHELAERVPNSRKSKLEYGPLKLAETAFAKGQFELASRNFEEAFKRL